MFPKTFKQIPPNIFLLQVLSYSGRFSAIFPQVLRRKALLPLPQKRIDKYLGQGLPGI